MTELSSPFWQDIQKYSGHLDRLLCFGAGRDGEVPRGECVSRCHPFQQDIQEETGLTDRLLFSAAGRD